MLVRDADCALTNGRGGGDEEALRRQAARSRVRRAHALVVAGFVDLSRQGDATERVAVKALAAQHALPVLRFLFALDLGAQRHLVAFDRDLDIVLAYAWNFGVNGVRLVSSVTSILIVTG